MKPILSKIVAASAVATTSFVIAATRCQAAPANDNLAHAQVIAPGSSFSVTGTDVNATQESFEQAPDYPLAQVTHTVWFSWTPTASGYLRLSTTHPTEKGVFRAPTPDQADFVAKDPAATGNDAFFVHVDAGQEYLFSIGNETAPAPFTLTGTITAEPAFFAGEAAVADGVYYLAFSTGHPFGYYSYLSDSRYFYHFDLGYEYVFDANDGQSGVYLYDFASSTFFYTSPGFPFPYLYDFTLQAVLYYYPDTNSPGHYTTGPRYFYNFATGKVITK